MRYNRSMLELIGDTPLMRLSRIASDVPPLVLAKMEMFNPGGSVKDRIGPAIAAAIKGYHCIFVMTEKASEEKRSLLRAYGAEVVICPSSVTHESPDYYKNVAHRLADEIPGAFCPDQYSNPA